MPTKLITLPALKGLLCCRTRSNTSASAMFFFKRRPRLSVLLLLRAHFALPRVLCSKPPAARNRVDSYVSIYCYRVMVWLGCAGRGKCHKVFFVFYKEHATLSLSYVYVVVMCTQINCLHRYISAYAKGAVFYHSPGHSPQKEASKI
jgi:hypothetical protein